MLPDPPRLVRCWPLSLLATLAACSAMPLQRSPAHVDYAFDARYAVGADGALTVPVTRRDLVIRELVLRPTPSAERFAGQARTLSYPPGTSVRAHGALRAYARPDGSLPTLAELLPGAELTR